MIAAYSNKDEKHVAEIWKAITQYHIGGLIFFQNDPVKQLKLTQQYQQWSKIPLMIGMDAEWGLAMRLDSTPRYPWQMTLGAIENDSLIYLMGLQIAQQCRRLGIHINFAPVVDLNNNPDNPVINARSFGENKYAVAKKSLMYMKGLLDGNVMACAKHFPGHGNTHVDSHKDLPVIQSSRNELNEYELYPFSFLMKFGLPSVMVGHIALPLLTGNKKLPATLSHTIVQNLLQDSLGFQGLIFTDALNMKGVSAYYPKGTIERMALMAGNDILLFSENIAIAIDSIITAVRNNLIDSAYIARKCHKILKAKEWLGLHHYKPVIAEKLLNDLNQPHYFHHIYRLQRKALTVAKNKENLLPVQNLNQKIAWFKTGSADAHPFIETLKLYTHIDSFSIHLSADSLYKISRSYDLILISHHVADNSPWKKYDLPDSIIEKVILLTLPCKAILVGFCNPYFLKKFPSLHNIEAIVIAYGNSPMIQSYTAQMIFGARSANGTLPVSVHPQLKAGAQHIISPIQRLAYLHEDEFLVDSRWIKKIDSLIEWSIRNRIFPGCQVLAAKNGKVFYHRAFGRYTYDTLSPAVTLQSMYDIASVTKIVATLPLIMKLQEERKITPDDPLKKHLPHLVEKHPHGNLTLKEILSHQSGLPAWVPFYLSYIHGNKLDKRIFATDSSKHFPLKVADSLYCIHSIKEKMYTTIFSIPLKKKEYRYSDIGFYFLKEIVEDKYGMSIDRVTCKEFFSTLGMNYTTYNPLRHFPRTQLVPTEYDTVFRHQLIHGYVHDPAAAMMGGIAGHAGLFSNANDLAKIMQMYLQYGYYGGKQYLDSSIVAEYSQCHYCEPDNPSSNRRGLGFDKPVRDQSNGPTFNGISFSSYGHTGFTGTMVWNDPDEKMLYVFLSNRVHPSAENKKLSDYNIRSTIQEWLYKSQVKILED